jgi:hypothetical protein
MTNEDKEKIYYLNKEREERDILMNKGVPVPFGTDVVNVKALEWNESNAFEDAVVAVAKKFKEVTGTEVAGTDALKKGVSIDEILETIVGIMRNDLVELATLSTRGLVTLNYIQEKHATKADVIKVLVEAFKLNYSYLGNLLALTKGLK